jgi:hypothetical protein
MFARTRDGTVTFKHPFTLPSVDGLQPAGTYRLVTDEEEILGLSFLAFRRTATMLHTPAISVVGGSEQVFEITPAELEDALVADKAVC